MRVNIEDIETPEDFLTRLDAAEIGTRLIYHKGFLAIDRQSSGVVLVALNRLTILTRILEAIGTIMLFSRKLNEGTYEYIAYKKKEQVFDLADLLEKIGDQNAFEEESWFNERIWELERKYGDIKSRN